MPWILIWKYFYKWITIESLIYFFFARKCIKEFERFCTICIIVFLMLQLILLRSQDSLFLCAKCSEMWNKNLEYNKHIWMHLFTKMYVLFTKTIIVKPRPKSQSPKAQPQPSQIQSKSVPKGLGLTLKSYGPPTTPPSHNF